MKVNSSLELLGTGSNFNVYTLSRNSLQPYIIDKNDVNFLHVLIRAFDRTDNSRFSSLISSNLKNVLVINMPDYPLPGFCTGNFIPVVNVAVFNVTHLSDFRSPDVYSSYLYALSFTKYVKDKSIKDSLEDQVALFIFNTFMNMFGKKSGLVGSFSSLTPKLRFIISMYVHERMFGYKIDDRFRSKVSSFLNIKYEDLKLNYDFSNPVDFLHCIKDNNIMSISENKFSSDLIKVSNVVSIPMFEDVSRLFSTIIASSIKGNNIFSNYWMKKSKDIYDKMYFYGLESLK